MPMIPSRTDLASNGLHAAVDDLATAEERAHAFLDVLRKDEAWSQRSRAALAALDDVDHAVHRLRLALRTAEPGPGEMVRLREREPLAAR